jgi:seryl-tRNA synthetase
MLSVQFVRDNPDAVRKALRDRQADAAPVDEIVRLDGRRRLLLQEYEALRAERNNAGKEIGGLNQAVQRAKDEGEAAVTSAKRDQLMARMRDVSERINELEVDLRQTEEQLQSLAMQLPNIPNERVPVGRDETENVVVRTEGERPAFDFAPRPHWEIGEALDIIDFERGVKLSGSRFYVLKGTGARLERALINWMLDLHVTKHGYTEVYPPFVVKEETLLGAGQLPKFADNLYHDVEDDVWLVPTAEVPVTNLHRDEILDGDALPVHYVAYTPCFRREKTSAGRDVRGIKRGHQFDKVEMYKFCLPEESDAEFDSMLRDAEEVLRLLGLPYRVVQLCTGDLGFAATMTFDLEVWAAGCEEWLEVSSVSNCADFQARRANVRFRREKGARPEFAHTLNGSGLALPRTVIAVLENYQQRGGSVVVPEVLRSYMGGAEKIG